MGLKDKLEFLRKKYEENGCRKFTNEEIAKYTEFVLLFPTFIVGYTNCNAGYSLITKMVPINRQI
jgi:hypothetical protein